MLGFITLKMEPVLVKITGELCYCVSCHALLYACVVMLCIAKTSCKL